jgi:AhpD family alkylhydroperoxidase
MPWIDYAAADGDPELMERISGGRRGTIPNVYRMLLNSPELTGGWVELANRVRFASVIDGATRELSILLIARLTSCSYEWDHHLPLAVGVGVSETDLAVVSGWPRGGGDPADWPAADAVRTVDGRLLRFVAAMTTRTDVGEAGLESWFQETDPRLVTEVAMTTAYYVGLAHLILALGVDMVDESP